MDELRSPGIHHTESEEPRAILERCYKSAIARYEPLIDDKRFREICGASNRAPARFLLACLLAKIHKPEIDIRKPYTEIGTKDCYSGRTYDEKHLQPFITKYNLPLNRTTAFLTPAFRTFNQPIYADTRLSGKPKSLYEALVSLLQDIHQGVQEGKYSAEDYLTEVLRLLVSLRKQQEQAIQERLQRITVSDRELTAQQIIEIISAHLQMPRSSRLPVLIIAAVYDTVKDLIGKRYVRLLSHTAADKPSQSLGDLEIEITSHSKIYAVYEIKARAISQDDIDSAIHKITLYSEPPKEYVFVSTKPIAQKILDYLREINRKPISTEFHAFDCLDFLKYFLHIFHERRTLFLENYKNLTLSEPESAVPHELKEKLLELIESTSVQSDSPPEPTTKGV
ncbi:MAG: DNA methyltransferase [Fimbriimonadales bacterium]|nr:MAG: DNA methyltransferase [Fimbriimonadales bacterium]